MGSASAITQFAGLPWRRQALIVGRQRAVSKRWRSRISAIELQLLLSPTSTTFAATRLARKALAATAGPCESTSASL